MICGFFFFANEWIGRRVTSLDLSGYASSWHFKLWLGEHSNRVVDGVELSIEAKRSVSLPTFGTLPPSPQNS